MAKTRKYQKNQRRNRRGGKKTRQQRRQRNTRNRRTRNRRGGFFEKTRETAGALASGAASIGRRSASAVMTAPGALTSRLTGRSKPRQGHDQVQGQGSSAPQPSQSPQTPKKRFGFSIGGKKTRRNRRNRRQRGGSGRRGPCVASNASNL